MLALLNIVLAPAARRRARSRSRSRDIRKRSQSEASNAHELTALRCPGTPGTPSASEHALRPTSSHASGPHRTPRRVNPNRTRIVYAVLVLLVYCAAGVLGALIGAAIIGYVLAGLFEAGKFNLST